MRRDSGRTITATARKIAVIIWHMLTEEVEFEIGKMIDRKPANKPDTMSKPVGIGEKALIERKEKSVVTRVNKKDTKKAGVARKKKKKVG